MQSEAGVRSVRLSPDQFMPLLEKVENGECLLIDVRNPDEFLSGRITGAMNIPVDTIQSSLLDLDRHIALLVYCKIGKRCDRAVDQLTSMGFQDIRVLEGGIEAWKMHQARRS